MGPVLLVAAGILLIVYGIIVRMAGSGTMFFAVWIAGGALLFLQAFLLKTGIIARFHPAVRTAEHMIAAAAAAALIYAFCLAAGSFHAEGRPGLDYIVVLGAQIYSGGPSRSLQYRLEKAQTYLEENTDTMCIVSGGQGWNEPETEGALMKRWLTEHGIAEERIIAEEKATTTKENLLFSRALMTGDHPSVGIVTNDFHVYRAVREAARQGMQDVCGIAAPSTRLFFPNNVLRECLAIIKYQFL